MFKGLLKNVNIRKELLWLLLVAAAGVLIGLIFAKPFLRVVY